MSKVASGSSLATVTSRPPIAQIQSTPQTDQKILECHRKGHVLFLITTLLLAATVALVFCILYWKEIKWLGEIGWSNHQKMYWIISISSSSVMTIASLIYNFSQYISLGKTMECLGKCVDLKSIEFIQSIKKMRKILILDTIFTFAPPIKYFTYISYLRASIKHKNMVEHLKRKKNKGLVVV